MSSPVNLNLTLAREGLVQTLAKLWLGHCLVCGEACGPVRPDVRGGSRALDLCPPCLRTLPWNRAACLRCGLPMPASTQACGVCLRRPSPLAQTHAVFAYGPPLDRLLPRLKFHQDLAAGRVLAELMAEALAGAPRPQALIPLPLHRARLRRRGYDQALELARPLARRLGLPLLGTALFRERDTAPQSRLDAAARRRNLRDAFAVRSGDGLPMHVAVIDDVMTTGATLHAAALALRRAGVARVDAWVCARVA